MKKFQVSIRNVRNGMFSVEIREIEKNEIAPTGICKLFKFVDDSFIFIKEITKRDIPGDWPNFNQWPWHITDFTGLI